MSLNDLNILKSPQSRILAALFLLITVVAAFFLLKRSNPSLSELLAIADAGDSARVTYYIDEWAKDQDRRDDARLLEAVVFLRAERFQKAISILSELDQDGPNRHAVLLYAGEALNLTRQFSDAAEVLALLVNEQPENVEGHRWLGATYYDLGAYDAAIVELKEVVRLAPNDFRPHYLLAIMYADFEQHADAIQQAGDALAKGAPENVRKDLLLVTARSQIALLQFDEALQKLDQVSASGEEALLRARCLIAKGDSSTVASLIERAKLALGETPELALLECDFLEQENHPEEAATRLDASLQKFSTNAELLYRSSLLHKQLGHNDLAAQRLADWEVYRDLSTELTRLNLKAIQEPFDAEVRDRLAEICTKLNKPELAAMWTEAANACREKSRQQSVPSPDSGKKAE